MFELNTFSIVSSPNIFGPVLKLCTLFLSVFQNITEVPLEKELFDTILTLLLCNYVSDVERVPFKWIGFTE